MPKPLHVPKTVIVTVSASGFMPKHIDVDKGDTVDFQGAPTVVTVTAGGTVSDPTVLFGTASVPVPSHQLVLAKFGAFHLNAHRHQAILVAHDPRELIPNDPPPKTR